MSQENNKCFYSAEGILESISLYEYGITSFTKVTKNGAICVAQVAGNEPTQLDGLTSNILWLSSDVCYIIKRTLYLNFLKAFNHLFISNNSLIRLMETDSPLKLISLQHVELLKCSSGLDFLVFLSLLRFPAGHGSNSVLMNNIQTKLTSKLAENNKVFNKFYLSSFSCLLWSK